MKYIAFLALLSFGLAPAAFAIDPPPTEYLQFDKDKVDHAFAKGGPISLNSSFKIQASHRVVPGVVEIHMHDTDIFYITEGSATFLTGGTAVDQKEMSPGEFHAASIEGGTEHHVSKGEVIVVPSGMPHQFTKIDGSLVYFVVKVTK